MVKSGTTAGQHDVWQPVGQADILSDVPPSHYLPMPLNAPRYRHLVAKSGTNLGPIDLSPCAIVCKRPSCLLLSSVVSRPSLVLTSTSSLLYITFSFQEYLFSCVKLSPFLQYLPKYSLLCSSLLHNTLNKVVWTWKDDWPPRRTSTYERPFTRKGNYLVWICTARTTSVQFT